MVLKLAKQISKYASIIALSAAIGATSWAYWNFRNIESEGIKERINGYKWGYQYNHPFEVISAEVKTKKNVIYGNIIQHENQKDIIQLTPNFWNFLVSGKDFYDSREKENLTNHPADDTNPVYSPDGKLIAFQSNREGNKKGELDRLYLIDRKSKKLSRITDEPSDINKIKWINNKEIEIHVIEKGVGKYILVNIYDKISKKEIKEGNNLRDIAPNFKLEDIAGNSIQLSDYRNKMPVILNLWETWCGPCRREMPSIQKFFENYNEKVEVLALTKDDNGNTREFIAGKNETRKPYTFRVLINKEGDAFNKFDNVAIPVTYIIDKQGRIVYKHNGAFDFMDSEGDIKKTIESLLSK